MAMPTTPLLIGIDASKAELHICTRPERVKPRDPQRPAHKTAQGYP